VLRIIIIIIIIIIISVIVAFIELFGQIYYLRIDFVYVKLVGRNNKFQAGRIFLIIDL
jgi:hypothetical protein